MKTKESVVSADRGSRETAEISKGGFPSLIRTSRAVFEKRDWLVLHGTETFRVITLMFWHHKLLFTLFLLSHIGVVHQISWLTA